MKPLTLRLSLFAQRLKKVVSRELYSEVIDAQQKAKQIFGIEVPFIVDTKQAINSYAFEALRLEKLAQHYWQYDVAKVFHKKIGFLCKEYSIDFKSVILFCVCHETGHAKEQRLFEEIGFFPNTFRILPEGVPITIESSDYVLSSHRIGEMEYHEVFSFGIRDFSINKELAKHNIRNELAKKGFFGNRGLKDFNVSTREQWHNYVLDHLLLLPLTIDVYEHGGLCEEEKRVLREAQEKVIGDKWEKALSKLSCIEFFSPKSKRDITMELFKNTLGVPAFLGCHQDRKILFRNYSSIPKYWNKKAYQVMYL